MKILELKIPADISAYEAVASIETFDVSLPEKQSADIHLCVVEDGKVHARCSLWWTVVPELTGERVGLIGHYAASSDVSASLLLEHACGLLKKQNCTIAIGPMDGNTWRRHRWVVDSGNELPFFLEPVNPPEYPKQWIDAGFSTQATYYSAITEELGFRDERMDRVGVRLKEDDVIIRPLNIDDFEGELRRIHKLSVIAFSHNYLYTPLSEDDFVEQYQKVRAYVISEHCLIAEDAKGDVVGFLFSIPDILRGKDSDTLIMKTLAVMPGRAYGGLGGYLMREGHERAYQSGFKRVIHALMHESNVTRNGSGRYTQNFRTYALFSKKLSLP